MTIKNKSHKLQKPNNGDGGGGCQAACMHPVQSGGTLCLCVCLSGRQRQWSVSVARGDQAFFPFERARPVPRVSAFLGQPITRPRQGVARLFRASPDFWFPRMSLARLVPLLGGEGKGGSSQIFGNRNKISPLSDRKKIWVGEPVERPVLSSLLPWALGRVKATGHMQTKRLEIQSSGVCPVGSTQRNTRTTERGKDHILGLE